ncbi:MAG: glycosyltransferase family 2 protein [Firmicutes bacterium]|jgi:glycosyltransferase involved in cell wall biosynthesis|nr:glycosyltransferase family 2 protein [Bacillota bacterium]MDH7494946.1 glycosyltransferase family 2 protein [Bacillota bacterium]
MDDGRRATCVPTRVAVIVPAYNEAARLGRVISAVQKARLVSEVIVVSDGSTDGTAEAALSLGVRVVELDANMGKGAAMKAGLATTDAEIVAFIDADLTGLTAEHVDELVRPVVCGEADATLGVFAGGRRCTTLAQRLTPGLSGQRAVKAALIRELRMEDARFGVEVLLNRHLASLGAKVKRVTLRGVSQVMKEEKRGRLEGFRARLRMYWEIVSHMKG